MVTAGRRRRVSVHYAWTFGRNRRGGRVSAHTNGRHLVDGPDDQTIQRRHGSVSRI